MRLSPEEYKAGTMSEANLKLALRTLRDTGYVVVEDVFDRVFVDEFRAAYDAELERHIAAQGGIEGINKKSFGKNHIGLHLPLIPPFSDPRVVANPIGVQIMEASIGSSFRSSFYHSNTAYPGSDHQQIHRDTGHLFKTDYPAPLPVTHVVVNIPLTDFTLENGSTEVWPGTHLIVDTDPADGSMEQLAERAKLLPSMRTNMPAGSLVVRDLRMWHRGMPNPSNEVRTMLALVYQSGWVAAGSPLDIPRTTWKAWPERVQEIYRGNKIVDTSPAEVAVPA
jgi:ectoine hydroxylase-related dioxygenase (phytanoyl-CoA dioxygenase family)